jgi:hypothetical protein
MLPHAHPVDCHCHSAIHESGTRHNDHRVSGRLPRRPAYTCRRAAAGSHSCRFSNAGASQMLGWVGCTVADHSTCRCLYLTIDNRLCNCTNHGCRLESPKSYSSRDCCTCFCVCRYTDPSRNGGRSTLHHHLCRYSCGRLHPRYRFRGCYSHCAYSGTGRRHTYRRSIHLCRCSCDHSDATCRLSFYIYRERHSRCVSGTA